MGLALASVALRAFVGGAVPMPWKTGLWALAAAAAAFLGKAAGGFLADRTSPRFAGVGALLLSLPLLCLGWAHPLPSLLGLLFFNMTMPVTLGTVADKLPNAPGLAFGLTAQFLIVGTLPLYGVSLGQGQALVLAAAGIFVSAACVALSSRAGKENSHETLRCGRLAHGAAGPLPLPAGGAGHRGGGRGGVAGKPGPAEKTVR